MEIKFFALTEMRELRKIDKKNDTPSFAFQTVFYVLKI